MRRENQQIHLTSSKFNSTTSRATWTRTANLFQSIDEYINGHEWNIWAGATWISLRLLLVACWHGYTWFMLFCWRSLNNRSRCIDALLHHFTLRDVHKIKRRIHLTRQFPFSAQIFQKRNSNVHSLLRWLVVFIGIAHSDSTLEFPYNLIPFKMFELELTFNHVLVNGEEWRGIERNRESFILSFSSCWKRCNPSVDQVCTKWNRETWYTLSFLLILFQKLAENLVYYCSRRIMGPHPSIYPIIITALLIYYTIREICRV